MNFKPPAQNYSPLRTPYAGVSQSSGQTPVAPNPSTKAPWHRPVEAEGEETNEEDLSKFASQAFVRFA